MTQGKFDLVYNRKNTSSHKWNASNGNAIQMWLADMDFKCPEEILASLRSLIDFGIMGYSTVDDDYYNAIMLWFNSFHNHRLRKEHIVPTSGVLHTLRAIISDFSKVGDYIIIQPPVYQKFQEIIDQTGRKTLCNYLVHKNDGTYDLNLKDLYSLKKFHPKIMVLCSPHNPVGKVWTREELIAICNFCSENKILLVVDEIHCDLIFKDVIFVSCGSLEDHYLDNIIILNSPTKTFNISGIGGGNALVFNNVIRNKLISCLNHRGLDKINSFFLEATKAGYLHCRGWVLNVMDYIEKNHAFALDYLNRETPFLRASSLEGTYLLWVNYQQLGIEESTCMRLLEQDVVVSPGSQFGDNGTGFIRINIGCPLTILENALPAFKKLSIR